MNVYTMAPRKYHTHTDPLCAMGAPRGLSIRAISMV
jgi:hypothetical protein